MTTIPRASNRLPMSALVLYSVAQHLSASRRLSARPKGKRAANSGFRTFAEDANFLARIRESGRQSCPVATGSFTRPQCGRISGFNALGDGDLLAKLTFCRYCKVTATLLTIIKKQHFGCADNNRLCVLRIRRLWHPVPVSISDET